MMNEPAPPSGPSEVRTRTVTPRLLLKIVLGLLVLWFVGSRAWALWQREELVGLTVRVRWLLASGMLYLVGWLPSAWFWHRMLHTVRSPVPWQVTLRSYFQGHLGKYVPGKAIVLVIRGEGVRGAGGNFRLGALTTAYETLFLMGMGLVIGCGLAGWVWGGETVPAWLRLWIVPPGRLALLSTVALLMVLPVLSRVLSIVARKMMPQEMMHKEITDPEARGAKEAFPPQPVRIPTGLLFQSALTVGFGWVVMGLSLGCCLRAVTPFDVQPLDVVRWTGAITLATSVGFLAIITPGGLGVREGLLIEALLHTPGVTGPEAVATAVLLRIVWLIAELLAAGLLSIGKRKPDSKPISTSPAADRPPSAPHPR